MDNELKIRLDKLEQMNPEMAHILREMSGASDALLDGLTKAVIPKGTK